MTPEHDWTQDVGKGWEPLVKAAILMVEAAGGKIVQVKEKFGLLRIYADVIRPNRLSESDSHEDIYNILNSLENISMYICEDCGSRDGVSTRPNKGRSWTLTLCTTCRNKNEEPSEVSKE